MQRNRYGCITLGRIKRNHMHSCFRTIIFGRGRRVVCGEIIMVVLRYEQSGESYVEKSLWWYCIRNSQANPIDRERYGCMTLGTTNRIRWAEFFMTIFH